MALTKSQAGIWQKARALGNGGQAVRLDDPTCSYLVARIAYDLDLQAEFPEISSEPPAFFSRASSVELAIQQLNAKELFER